MRRHTIIDTESSNKLSTKILKLPDQVEDEESWGFSKVFIYVNEADYYLLTNLF